MSQPFSAEYFADEAKRLQAVIEREAEPTIKLRIRVGVTADGSWSAIGADDRTSKGYGYSYDTTIADDPVVAWHWITAEVPMPMPEAEQGEVAGEVER